MPLIDPTREGLINQWLLIRDHTLHRLVGNQSSPYPHLPLHQMQGTGQPASSVIIALIANALIRALAGSIYHPRMDWICVNQQEWRNLRYLPWFDVDEEDWRTTLSAYFSCGMYSRVVWEQPWCQYLPHLQADQLIILKSIDFLTGMDGMNGCWPLFLGKGKIIAI